jgi:phospholipid-translocating ATPase
MIFYLVQAMYQRWNGYTGTSLYEPWSLSMFNTLFTSLPVIFMCVFEQAMKAATLLAVPELYAIGPLRQGFNFKRYFHWAVLGAVEAVLVYFTIYGLYGESLIKRDNGVFSFGVLAYSACVILINLKLQAIDLHNKTYMAAAAIVIEVGGWFLWNLILGATYDRAAPVYDVRGGIFHRWGRSLLFWITLLAVVVAILLLEIVLKTAWFTLKPGDTEIFQALEKDPEVRKRFEESAAHLLQQGWERGSKRPSYEAARHSESQAEREAQVEDLLSRPRTVDTTSSSSMPKPNTSHAEEDRVLETADGAGIAERHAEQLFSKGFGKVMR